MMKGGGKRGETGVVSRSLKSLEKSEIVFVS